MQVVYAARPDAPRFTVSAGNKLAGGRNELALLLFGAPSRASERAAAYAHLAPPAFLSRRASPPSRNEPVAAAADTQCLVFGSQLSASSIATN